jgi:hypothetical protein
MMTDKPTMSRDLTPAEMAAMERVTAEIHADAKQALQRKAFEPTCGKRFATPRTTATLSTK